MSNSIIHFQNKSFNPNDIVLFVTLSIFKKSVDMKKLPLWFNNYLEIVINELLEIKPIGWSYLKLDDFFKEKKKRLFFIDLIKNCLNNIGDTNLSGDYINELLLLEDIEKLSSDFYFEISSVKNCLKSIILLLDDSINFSHNDLDFYEETNV